MATKLYIVCNGESCTSFEDKDDADIFYESLKAADNNVKVHDADVVPSSKKYKLLNDQPSAEEFKDLAENLEFLRDYSFEAQCCNASFPINSLRNTIKDVLIILERYSKLIEKAEKWKMTAMNNEGMAECMDMVRQDLIQLGIVDKSVPPMMLTGAILEFIYTIKSKL